MSADDVLIVLDALDKTGVRVWLDGGWGVDALLGEQHRDHDDVDIVVELDDLDAVVTALGECGYGVAEDFRPTRLVLRSRGDKHVDVHPVTFDKAGTGWQIAAGPDGMDCPYPESGFTTGSIASREVGCLAAELQVEHHRGYEPHEADRHDMKLLCEALGVELPHGY